MVALSPGGGPARPPTASGKRFQLWGYPSTLQLGQHEATGPKVARIQPELLEPLIARLVLVQKYGENEPCHLVSRQGCEIATVHQMKQRPVGIRMAVVSPAPTMIPP